MGTTREILEFIIKADGTAASNSFKKVGDTADDATKKLGSRGSGLSGALSSFGLNAATATAAVAGGVAVAGAAIAGFAIKGINDFQKVALGAGELADKTGLAIDEASRWNEVAGDIGISTESLASAFFNLEKRIGANPDKFKALGITAQDAGGQMLQALDVLRRTPEGAERAALSVELFGKSFQGVSELVGLGSSEIVARLKDVSEAKIIDSEELSTARDYRAAMDNLGDAVGDLGIAFGQKLVPGIARAAEGLAKILESGPVKFLLETIGTAAEATGESLGNLADWDGPDKQAIAGVDALTNTLKVLGGASIEAYEAALKAANPDVKTGPWEEQKQAALGYRDGANYAAKAAAEWEAGASLVGTAAQSAIAPTLGLGEALGSNVAGAFAAAEEAATDYLTAVLLVEGSSLAAEAATDRVGDSVGEAGAAYAAAAEAVKKFGPASAEAAAANEKADDTNRDLRGSVLGVAAAALKAAEDQATLAGKTLTAKDKADAQTKALQDLKTAYPQVGAQVDTLIGKINATPPTKTTTVNVTDNGTVAATQHRIDSVRDGSAVIHVSGDFSDYEAAKRRVSAPGGGRIAFAEGGIVPGSYNQAVPVTAHGSELILNPQQQANMLWQIANGGVTGGSSGGGSVNVTVNMPPGSDGADVVRAIEEYRRRNGGGRIRAAVA